MIERTNCGDNAVERVPAGGRGTHLPTVDISSLRGSLKERAKFAVDLRRILHDHGFFYLSGHGVDPALIVELTTAAGRFFALPDYGKLEIEMTRSPHFRGYTPAAAE